MTDVQFKRGHLIWFALFLVLGGCDAAPSISEASDADLRRSCGNGNCGGAETCSSCPQDCGACGASDLSSPITTDMATSPITTDMATSPVAAGAYPPDSSPLVNHAMPSLPSLPALGSTYTNLGSGFGLSSPAGDTISKHISNEQVNYAKHQQFNMDSTLIVLGLDAGARVHSVGGGWPYTGVTVNFDNGSYQSWSNTDRRWIYGLDNQGSSGSNQLKRFDATTGSKIAVGAAWTSLGGTTVTDVSFGGNEGGIAADDSAMSMIANGKTIPFVVDARDGHVRCVVMGGGGCGGSGPPCAQAADNDMVSHDGKYLVVGWSSTGGDLYSIPSPGSATTACPWVSWQSAKGSWGSVASVGTGHFDTCVSVAGEQVTIDEHGTMVDLATGNTTQVWDRNGSPLHVSCRNMKRDGWTYVSWDNADPDACARLDRTFAHMIVAAKLDASKTYERFSWDYAACSGSGTSYAQGAKASPNPDGTMVIFSTNWLDQATGTNGTAAMVAGKSVP